MLSASDLPWAANDGTAEPADLDAEMDGTAVRRQVPKLPIIPTMNLRRSCAALRAGSIWRHRAGHDQQTVRLGRDGLDQKTGKRFRLN
jgi:hypothetical protein